jgi:hypothetical protein
LALGSFFEGHAASGRFFNLSRTNPTVVELRVSTFEFMASVCRILGIGYSKQNLAPNGRPIRIVDTPPPTPVAWLF